MDFIELRLKDADTAGLAFDYFVNDNVSLDMVLGAPPKMKLSGVGRVNLIGNLGVELGDYDNIAVVFPKVC